MKSITTNHDSRLTIHERKENKMVEAWIFAIFCLLIGLPIGLSERRKNYGYTKHAKRCVSSRIQRIKE